MEYVAIDLEWNQPETADEFIKTPISFPGEIIQIGAVRLNEKFEAEDEFNVFIKPAYYTHLHCFVASLTNITEDMLAQGTPFCEAIDSFREWCPEDCIFITWSNSDKKILKQNIRMHGGKYNWLPHAIDIQPMFSYYVAKDCRCYSLPEAIACIGEPEFVSHNALNDAVATAKIGHYLRQLGTDFQTAELFLKKAGKKTAACPSPAYASAYNARKSRNNRNFICSECGKTVSCKWISMYGNKSYSLAECECGKEYFVRLIIKANPDGTKRANRTVTVATDEDRQFCRLKQKKEAIKSYNRYCYRIDHINSKKIPSKAL